MGDRRNWGVKNNGKFKMQRVSSDILHWGILGVPLIPSVFGSVVVLYLVTTFFGWNHYTG
jgi:hypothetical protein